jgi:pantothenate kinase
VKGVSSVAFQHKGAPIELVLTLLSAASTSISEGMACDSGVPYLLAAICCGISIVQTIHRRVFVSVGCATTGGLSRGTPDPFQTATDTMDAGDSTECVLQQKRKVMNQ